MRSKGGRMYKERKKGRQKKAKEWKISMRKEGRKA
jgi:hypothetical protein